MLVIHFFKVKPVGLQAKKNTGLVVQLGKFCHFMPGCARLPSRESVAWCFFCRCHMGSLQKNPKTSSHSS